MKKFNRFRQKRTRGGTKGGAMTKFFISVIAWDTMKVIETHGPYTEEEAEHELETMDKTINPEKFFTGLIEQRRMRDDKRTTEQNLSKS